MTAAMPRSGAVWDLQPGSVGADGRRTMCAAVVQRHRRLQAVCDPDLRELMAIERHVGSEPTDASLRARSAALAPVGPQGPTRTPPRQPRKGTPRRAGPTP
jgi:hypothetical protein